MEVKLFLVLSPPSTRDKTLVFAADLEQQQKSSFITLFFIHLLLFTTDGDDSVVCAATSHFLEPADFLTSSF